MSLLNYLLPKAATIQTLGHPGAGIIGWLGGAATNSGVAVNEDTAMTYSAAYACTRLLAGTSAMIPWNVYTRLDGGGRDLLRDHEVQYLLNVRPNPSGIAAFDFRANLMDCKVNWGNAYAEIERDNSGRPIALWQIHPSRVKPFRADGGIFYNVSGGSGQVTIPAADMFHVMSVVNDGLQGKGVITVARESIGFGIATEEHGAAYFRNHAMPMTVLKHPKTLGKQARDNLREEWQSTYGGTTNTGKVAVLWEGMELQTLSLSPEDSQFLGTRQHNVEEVARWYDVPPHMIGHLLRSTFNNIAVQGTEYVSYKLMPHLRAMECQANIKLFSEDELRQGVFTKHVADALLRGDSESRTKALQTQFMHGVLTEDEWREVEDRNPLPDGLGKRFFVPANLMLAEDAGKQAETAAPPGFAKAPPPDDQDQEDVEPADKEEASLPPFARDAALTLPPSALARLYKPAAVNRFKDEWFAVPDLADDDKPQAALHCMGHAVDGTTSVSPAWLKAWGEEIRGGKLSEHARINSREGFAEFCRLAWMDPMTADREFPGCFAVLVRQHLAYRDEEMKVEFKPTINIPETVVHVAAPVVNVAAPAITVEAAPAPHVNFVVDTQSIAAAFAEATQQGSDALTSIAISQDKIANREMPARTIEIKAPSGQTYSGKAENT